MSRLVPEMTSRTLASWRASSSGPLLVDPNHSTFHDPISSLVALPRGGIDTSRLVSARSSSSATSSQAVIAHQGSTNNGTSWSWSLLIGHLRHGSYAERIAARESRSPPNLDPAT